MPDMKADPVNRWHDRQWQLKEITGLAVQTYRMAPQAQPP
jgi:hypothetical protein